MSPQVVVIETVCERTRVAVTLPRWTRAARASPLICSRARSPKVSSAETTPETPVRLLPAARARRRHRALHVGDDDVAVVGEERRARLHAGDAELAVPGARLHRDLARGVDLDVDADLAGGDRPRLGADEERRRDVMTPASGSGTRFTLSRSSVASSGARFTTASETPGWSRPMTTMSPSRLSRSMAPRCTVCGRRDLDVVALDDEALFVGANAGVGQRDRRDEDEEERGAELHGRSPRTTASCRKSISLR